MSDSSLEVDLSTLGGIAFAIPAYDGKVVVEQLAAVYHAGMKLNSMGVKSAVIYEKGNALVDYSRNRLVAKFLKDSTAQKLVFLDSDIKFKWEDLERLLVFSSKYPIVCGTYPAKKEPTKFFINPVYTTDGKLKINEYGLLSITGCGAGFMIIDRSVFLRMEANSKKFSVDEDIITQYFYNQVVGTDFYGEDVCFLHRWVKEFGGEVWLDPGIDLIHIGNKDYDAKFSGFFPDFIRQAEENKAKEIALRSSPNGSVATTKEI